MFKESLSSFFNILLKGLAERIPIIPMRRQLIVVGFCVAVLFLGLSFIRPYVDIILDILLMPCIIFGCYFGYTVLVIKKNSKKVLEEVPEN